MSFERTLMYSSLFDAVFPDSFVSPMRTVYVVSDSQLEELRRKQHQEELNIDGGSMATAMGQNFKTHCQAYSFASKSGVDEAFNLAKN